MAAQTLNKSYSLAALLIHASKQEVTREKIMAVFSSLNLECSSKIASMFELPAQKYSDILSNTGSSSAAPVVDAKASSAAAAAAAPEAKEESDSSSAVIEF